MEGIELEVLCEVVRQELRGGKDGEIDEELGMVGHVIFVAEMNLLLLGGA
jgi:hypothetical protein